jgi:predicted metal-dependent hydrolase
MTAITARVPKVDWSQGFDRHWNGGNPAVSHAFNALSFLFPQAERFFIQVAREVASSLDTTTDCTLAEAVQGFIAQESCHSHQHNQYNVVLEQQGFENVVEKFISRLQVRSHRDFSPLTKLAIVCGYEHYTAILGNYILSNPAVLRPASPDMALVWGWHSAEETEHKAVCFDLYRAAGGGWFRRVLVFLAVTLNFCLMFGRLYSSLLYRDGCLKPLRLSRTIWQSARFFFGVSGVAWHLLGHGIRYLSPWFHPWNQDNRSKLQAWLSTNHSRLRAVGERQARRSDYDTPIAPAD